VTLRRRLTLWYGGLLAVVLASALALAYVIHVDDHDADINAALQAMTDQAVADVHEELAGGALIGELDLVDLHRMIDEPHAVWLFKGNELVAAAGRTDEPSFVAVAPERLAQGWHESWTVDGRVRSLVTEAEGGTRIVAVTSLAEMDSANAQLRFVLVILGVGAVFVGVTVGSTIAGSALKPVARMTDTAAEIARSRDFSRRVGVQDDNEDELARLGVTFDEMLVSLDAAYRQQQRFVADVSHELRTPLTTIRGNAELLAAGESAPAEQRQAVGQIRREAERLSRLVGELLVLARADAVEAFAPRPFQLDEVLLEAFGELRSVAGPRLRVRGIDAVVIDGERDRLKELVLLLLDNALRYTPHDGLVEASLADDGKDAVLRVDDEGIGIAMSDLPRVFDRFYRGAGARRMDASGSGLGLPIARWIAERHGGTIAIESREGAGTRVTLRLPLRVPARPEGSAKA